ANAAHATHGLLLQTHEVQQLGVKLLVERVGVGPLRGVLLQQKGGAEEAPEVGKLGRGSGHRARKVHVHGGQRAAELGEVLAGHLLVKVVGAGARERALLKLEKELVKLAVAHKEPVKVAGVEDVPVEARGHDKAAQLGGLAVGLVLAVVLHQLLKGLAVEVGALEHLAGVFAALHLHDEAHRVHQLHHLPGAALADAQRVHAGGQAAHLRQFDLLGAGRGVAAHQLAQRIIELQANRLGTEAA
nr:hypothetical protein [Tanacetum cinerariifolium]